MLSFRKMIDCPDKNFGFITVRYVLEKAAKVWEA